MACSQAEEKHSDKSEIPEENSDVSSNSHLYCQKMPSQGLGTFIAPKTVHWMYLDDSLKNVCRALNFRLPYMGSDIKVIPEMITPEILGLSPIRTFETVSKQKVILNDSLSFFHYKMKRDNCECDVMRIYKGNSSVRGFDGFEITEQIVCNAQDELICCYESNAIAGVKKKNEENDSTKYEIHGHEH